VPDVPPQIPSRRLVILSSLTLAGAVVLLFGLWPLTGGDFLMWVTVGRYTWAHGWPPLVDVFSYTSAGEEFIAHSWLTGLLFYLTEQAAGVVGLGLLRLVLVSTALWFALRTARMLGASWSAVMLVAPFVLGIMWARLEFRPQLFTTLLLACQLWLLISVHTGQRSWRWLWVLPPVYALWVNLHGGWVMGIAMLGAVVVALGAMEVRRRWLANLLENSPKGRGRKKSVAISQR
jgi:hypothetical protein